MQQQILMALAASAAGGTSTWDPTKRSTNVALSSGDRMAEMASLTGTVLSTNGFTTSKRYFEVYVDLYASGAGGFPLVGIARSGGSTDLDSDLGQDAGEYGWAYNGNSYFAGAFGGVTGLTFTTGDTVKVAVDFATRRVWWGVNGSWVGSGNPAAGTGQQVTFATGLGTIYAAVSGRSGNRLQSRLNAGELAYSPPSGFSAWGA